MKKILFNALYFVMPVILCISCNNEEVDPGTSSNVTTSEPVVSTFVGSIEGDKDGFGKDAQLFSPARITLGNDNFFYFTDGLNHKIKKISPLGEVITIAGSKQGYHDGQTTEAEFNRPWGIAFAKNGDIYVSDTNRIRKISTEGVVTTFSGNGKRGLKNGSGNVAEFSSPAGLAFAPDGSLYVADFHNHAIRKITPDGTVSTIAGGEEGFKDGSLSEAKFSYPSGISIDDNGNIFIADSHNHRIRKISNDNVVSTVAGDGKNLIGASPDAILVIPIDVSVSKEGELFVADTRGLVIHIDKTGKTSWYAGSIENGFADGPASEARFNFISGLTVAPDGNVYVCDPWSNLIRKISKE